MKKVFMSFIVILIFGCNGNAQKKDSSKNTSEYTVTKTDAEWKEILTPQEFEVLRNASTERPFSSALNNVKEPGTFVCAACGNELFKTEHKFESGTGWPSFDRPLEGGVGYGSDTKLGYQRDEIHCADCGGHLGHVFDDGPRATTGKRYCMNGVAMEFIPDEKSK